MSRGQEPRFHAGSRAARDRTPREKGRERRRPENQAPPAPGGRPCGRARARLRGRSEAGTAHRLDHRTAPAHRPVGERASRTHHGQAAPRRSRPARPLGRALTSRGACGSEIQSDVQDGRASLRLPEDAWSFPSREALLHQSPYHRRPCTGAAGDGRLTRRLPDNRDVGSKMPSYTGAGDGMSILWPRERR